MTTLRTAAQQALEAMSNFESGTNGLYEGEFAQEIAALKAALVEDAMQKFTDVNQELEAALAEHYCDTHCTWADHAAGCIRAEPVQEPVAWMDIDRDGNRLSVRQWSDGNLDEVPLYTAPPQRKPLTEEEMLNLIDDVLEGGSLVDVARAIERAHNIKE